MKKLFNVILLLALTAILLCGCQSTPAEAEQPASAAEPPEDLAEVVEPNLYDEIMEKGYISVATCPDFAPMEFVDSSKTGDDKYVGFDIELAKYLAEHLGVELKLEVMEFPACQAGVASGAVDISISGYSMTDERKENFELSDFYYAGDNESEQCILLLEENAEKYSEAADFTGVDVAAQNASLQMNLLTKQLPEANPITVTDLGTAVMELINGKVEALCVAKGNGEMFMAQYDGLAFSQFEFEVAEEEEANVILIPKGETVLLEKINEVLAQAYKEGVYGPWYEEAEALGIELGQLEG